MGAIWHDKGVVCRDKPQREQQALGGYGIGKIFGKIALPVFKCLDTLVQFMNIRAHQIKIKIDWGRGQEMREG